MKIYPVFSAQNVAKCRALSFQWPPLSSRYAIEHSISAILWWSGTSGTLGGKIDYLWCRTDLGEGRGGVVHFGLAELEIAMKSLEDAINFCHHMAKSRFDSSKGLEGVLPPYRNPFFYRLSTGWVVWGVWIGGRSPLIAACKVGKASGRVSHWRLEWTEQGRSHSGHW